MSDAVCQTPTHEQMVDSIDSAPFEVNDYVVPSVTNAPVRTPLSVYLIHRIV